LLEAQEKGLCRLCLSDNLSQDFVSRELESQTASLQIQF